MNPRHLARLIYPEFRFGKTPLDQALKLVDAGVGGFCFYGGTADEVRDAARTLKDASGTPLLIAADYEDGVGRWVKGGTELPTNMAIGASGSPDLARRKGEITALEAKALGVDWIFAPVVDLAVRPANPIVNVRAFGADWRLAAELAGAYMSGVNSQGALCALKHFPGHGDTETDSHLELPEVNKDRQAFEDGELKPYRALARAADAVMVGHLKVPAYDAANPASLSGKVIKELLRGELAYGGLVITDALNMKALSGAGEPGVRAFLAGADILLFPEDPFKLLAALERAALDGTISEALVAQALARQDALVRKLSPFRSAPPPQDVVRCAEHLAWPAEAAPACLAWAYGGGKFTLKAGETAGYYEPGTAQKDWKGAAFIEALSGLGVRVVPYEPGRGLKLVAGVFSRPRAYSAAINLGPDERTDLACAIKGAAGSVIAAFGSPFVLDGLERRPDAALCAFCSLGEFQQCAAGVLAGTARAAGTMPVTLKDLS
ncbi:MAG TPA: glycoside hydrolase family 3 N-terminal domain-containing protein [Elusimicrobiales bacterium]|nr:glycoside hydrolase family 3 N-terminal domain-containing protein [Elusimicrobiales bacterium]